MAIKTKAKKNSGLVVTKAPDITKVTFDGADILTMTASTNDDIVTIEPNQGLGDDQLDTAIQEFTSVDAGCVQLKKEPKAKTSKKEAKPRVRKQFELVETSEVPLLRFQRKAVYDALKNVGGIADKATWAFEITHLLTEQADIYMVSGKPFRQDGMRILNWYLPELKDLGLVAEVAR